MKKLALILMAAAVCVACNKTAENKSLNESPQYTEVTETTIEGNMEEEAYMALYEPKQSGPADISRALAIEEEAWETAALLSTEDEELIEEAPVLPLVMPTEPSQQEEAGESLGILFSENSDGDDFDFIETALSDTEREALKAALDGRFSAYCRGIGEMAESVRARINEAAMEAIGDMIIESDFSVLADYIDEIQDKLV